eukprot:TRINITY_DN59822_c0_g1_i1.p1 TRINITY_DN59822_c0_g1~~TRINITY_DN59822_c0_g1_i1.p1  ORF type:complete len:323 (+),score=84.10 TRINITY_DN59822_c0_g1_i1:175-1143(+)
MNRLRLQATAEVVQGSLRCTVRVDGTRRGALQRGVFTLSQRDMSTSAMGRQAVHVCASVPVSGAQQLRQLGQRVQRQQRRAFHQHQPPEQESQNPIEVAKAFQRDIEMFPEYFNPVTYALFTLLLVYLLYLTSNNRGRSWFFRHFALSEENFAAGRLYTLLTHPLLETSAVSMLINLALLRWGGNMILNVGGGDKGFVRAWVVLTVGPGVLYSGLTAVGRSWKTEESYVAVGGAVVPTKHFATEDVMAGTHGVTAGLLANGILEMGTRFPASNVFGLRPAAAMPALVTFYFLLATSGSSDSWLSLCGVVTAITYRTLLRRGF